jgi:imidazole glycerol phosphate synthase glutamine amidotransferase subunit
LAIEVEVLDLGINNLASLRRGLRDAGAKDLRVVASSNESRGADLMVLPGVGAFGAAMDELEQRGLGETLHHHVASGGYLFGVCLGMQLLTSASEESPGIAGLDFIPGQVRRLIPNAGTRVPNMGWGSSRAVDDAEPFSVLNRPVDFYFVHSFAVVPENDAHTLAVSEFGDQPFVSAIAMDNIIGVQFHPEKSSRPGSELLSQVLEWADG